MEALTLSWPGRAGPHVWSWRLREAVVAGHGEEAKLPGKTLHRAEGSPGLIPWNPAHFPSLAVWVREYTWMPACLPVGCGTSMAEGPCLPPSPLLLSQFEESLKLRNAEWKITVWAESVQDLEWQDIRLWGAPPYGVSVSSPWILVPWSAASRNSAPCARDFQSKDIQHGWEHTGCEQSNETVVWLCLISGQKWVSCCNLKDQRYSLGNFRNMKYVGAAIYET